MEWKDIKKELPEINEEVLITDGEEMVSATRTKSFNDELRWTGYGFGGYEWEFDVDEDNITHWMPLPDLPKKEKRK